MDNTKAVNIDYTSNEEGKRYQGTFTIKRLSILDSVRLEVRKVQLNGGYYYSENTPGVGVPEAVDNFNKMVAHLEAAVVSAPKWWNLEDITDAGLVVAVYKEVAAFESSFSRGRSDSQANGRTQDGQGLSSKASQGTVTTLGTAEMVPAEISAALEP